MTLSPDTVTRPETETLTEEERQRLQRLMPCSRVILLMRPRQRRHSMAEHTATEEHRTHWKQRHVPQRWWAALLRRQPRWREERSLTC